jgi:hypothetical protein
MTFSEMQTDAKDLVHELVNAGQYSDTKLKHYINRGNLEFVKRTRCIEDYIDITTVENQFEYTESDASDLQYVYLPYQFRYITGATEVGEKLRPYPGGYTGLPKTKEYGDPSYYWVINSHTKNRSNPASFTGIRLGTWPIIGTAGNTLRVDAFFWPRTLSGDADVPEYKEAWHDAPVYWAAYRLFFMFGHLRQSWYQKSGDMKKIFDEYVTMASQETMENDDGPFIPPDVVQRTWHW